MGLDEPSLVEDLLEGPPDALDVARCPSCGRGRRCRPSSPSARSSPRTRRRSGRRTPGTFALNSATPYASMSCLPLKPSSFSTPTSTGQPVAVPAALAVDPVALHGLEAREDVLEDTGLDVVDARACRWRSAVPRRRSTEARPPAARATPRRCPSFSPEREDLALQGRQVDLGGYGAVRWLIAVVPPIVWSVARLGEGTRSEDPAVPPFLTYDDAYALSWCAARRVYCGLRAVVPYGRRSSGGSEVMAPSRRAAGLPPSPDRLGTASSRVDTGPHRWHAALPVVAERTAVTGTRPALPSAGTAGPSGRHAENGL